ncbi:cytochrome b5 reductase 4 isoform X2 [Photinus pyralis]|uniref:cytochrome b5 reductase 4 isoform X2 n=1 Tax=Photinus pyralis TaxID=7054 RepID=UPI001267799B|nr:cytochrome b5 reductase 4 isoform X2 [Photinus pyralis]
MPCLSCCWKIAEEDKADIADGSRNPRNKHALQPGHSLMDWIRLGSSGKDLTGFGARAGQLSVTPHQLAQHNQLDDAWLAIRGKVYNVTHYLPFHPGGAEELQRGIGKDATTLFDEVHAWVNYESLLQKCYLGRLVSVDPEVDTHQLLFGSQESPNKKKNIPSKVILPNKVTPINIEETTQELNPCPKFDWVQKTDYITLIFYTGPLSNAKIEIQSSNSTNDLNVCLTYDGQVFANEIRFTKEIKWPGQIKLNYETGKVEMQLKKLQSGIWDTYGTLRQTTEVASIKVTDKRCRYRIVNKIEVNYNTSFLELERCDDTKLTVPIGRHVRVFLTVQDQDISRSYTPIPNNVLVKFNSQSLSVDKLCLMVKSYSNGILSNYICGRKKGDVLEISDSLGSFSLKSLDNRETFLLLAAGTGITPILKVLLFLLERRIRRCKNVTLLFFNKTEKDILLKDQLETLHNEDSRFRVEHILSQADSNWTGHKGKISNNLLRDSIDKHLLNTVYKESDIFACICGPTQFSHLAQSLLTSTGFNREQMHVFLG